MNGMYRLTIEKSNGHCITVHGTEEILKSELEAWVQHEHEAQESWKQADAIGEEWNDYEAAKPRVIHGICDSADRAEAIVAYRLCDVVGMVMIRL